MNSFNVLIVQPDINTSDYLTDILSEYKGFTPVGISRTQKEAIYMIDRFEPHLVIMDNLLQSGSGLNILRYLNSRSKYEKQIPDTIFITEDTRTETFKQSLRLGAFDYIVRPLSTDRISASLSRYFRYISSTRSCEYVTQQRIDESLSQPYTIKRRSPKGIDELTLGMVKSAFSDKGVKHTAVTLSQQQSISKTTARRYLEHGVRCGFLETGVKYGNIGRPERVYQLNSLH